MKKLSIIFLIALLAGFMSCSVEADSSGHDGTSIVSAGADTDSLAEDDDGEYVETASGDSFVFSKSLYINLSAAQVSSDNSTWSDISTKSTKFFDKTVKVSFDESIVNEDESNGVIKINAKDISENLSVYLTGTLSEGGVKIQTAYEYEVALYLNDVSISSTNYPCLEITKGGAANIFLSGENIFVDGRKYGTGYGEEYSETSGETYDDDGVETECELSKSVEKDGSDSKGTLYCKGGIYIGGDGSLSVTQAYKNCIATKNGYLTIGGGTLILKNYKSSSDTGKNGLYGGRGIIINEGTITFDGKGIISTSDVRKANVLKTDDETYPESYVEINGGSITATTYNGKGINSPFIYLNGGSTNFSVSGVTNFVKDNNKSGTYYDADGVLNSNVSISFAAEGFEGDSGITVAGGNHIVYATDDALNVSASGGALVVSGGFLFAKTTGSGDGLDSNGSITVSGGVVVVSQTGGGNSPIDAGDGYKFAVTGGTVLALGSSDMFSESIPSSSSNAFVYSKNLGSSNSSLAVNTSDGTNLVYLASPQTYAAAIFISPDLTSGSSYKFVKGGSVIGQEYVEGTGFYLPADSVSGGSSTSVTATKQASASGNGRF